MDNRKNWTYQQGELRKLLSSKTHFAAGIALFTVQHAAVHTAEISDGKNWSLQDEVLTNLDASQIKKIPPTGQNSIAWLLWHTTRIEDMTINTLTCEQPQVWTPGWAVRLNFASRDCGASMNEQAVSAFSQEISVNSLLEYRAEVGRRTRENVKRLTADQAREIISLTILQKLVDEGSISPQAHWLFEYYTNRSRGFFLTRTATSHNFIHLNEAGRIKTKLTRQ